MDIWLNPVRGSSRGVDHRLGSTPTITLLQSETGAPSRRPDLVQSRGPGGGNPPLNRLADMPPLPPPDPRDSPLVEVDGMARYSTPCATTALPHLGYPG